MMVHQAELLIFFNLQRNNLCDYIYHVNTRTHDTRTKKDYYIKIQESEDHLNAYNRTHWTGGEHNRQNCILEKKSSSGKS